ncbi:LytR/AlgR family response regulator transcription factor [Pseudoalteromonas tunicata]|jgi:DNA-binding LytR/AlgR family response regulator|uniref:Putative response regulator n=1 Tax=Pseudoalteromonas tunicata D2 TaxID=87626 RepID=A4CDM0_9GAMM|nr:LytTR family DNA-binding domain-containing protein [Pseudoalteromonas tunicata]ATC96449.1 hypothetical protein PTUN_a4255 [Pseudoalteromonas tunicata]AXT31931.1 DNA-binding response regulator [Pseudoalteromonas tunicata]EAR27062.1 putative response regulator [Pseudoalteromonas tunicata D2]MDP4982231.1 LytTR family DNA-binding domain-containing protein [Pseudoalteromonas tunicata]MDP5212346.1 LytTR family DNA-binding domain-containing protein [Pseudoalteromonas tunicata]
MSQVYTALIADDEPLLRRHLIHLLDELWPELTIIAQASDGEDAWEKVLETEPDIAFLDIRMPALDGISLCKRFTGLDKIPHVVFTTAYDQHAVEAFENQAIDYLLKPIEEERLNKTILRLKTQLAEKQNNEPEANNTTEQQKLLALLEKVLPATAPTAQLKWIRASKNNVIHMIDIAEVDYFLAEDKYTTVSCDEEKYLIKTTITSLVEQLDSDVFWRVHRNCIVRVSQIAKVERDFSGYLFVYLKQSAKTGQPVRLNVSRSYQHLFKQM